MAAPKFATGKHASGVCDRCGVSFKRSTLKALTINEKRTNLLVCNSCFESDHPQYQVGKYPVYDPQALRDPRPDSGDATSQVIQWGWNPVGLNNALGLSNLPNMLEATGEVGTVTVTT